MTGITRSKLISVRDKEFVVHFMDGSQDLLYSVEKKDLLRISELIEQMRRCCKDDGRELILYSVPFSQIKKYVTSYH